MPNSPLPAPSTKHLDVLEHPIPRVDDVLLKLRQLSSAPSDASSPGPSQQNSLGGSMGSTGSTGTTGTTLWLGAQVMACYLADILPPPTSFTLGQDEASKAQSKGHKRVLELGAGVGYLSLCLAYWGYNVIATDIEPVLSRVLAPNVEENLVSGKFWNKGTITPQHLDWLEVERRESIASRPDTEDDGVGQFDFIVTTDTLYAPALVIPLWIALRLLSRSPNGAVLIYIALENRDPRLIEHALQQGRELGFELKRIAPRRVEKAVEKAKWGWKREDWDGVEIWKARYRAGS